MWDGSQGFWLSPLSCSQSGDEAPLHSLRGPNTGDTCSKPSRDPEPGSWSRSGPAERDGGGEEEEEGYGQEDESRGYGEEGEGNGQGRSRGADVELMLQVDCVSGSSSDVVQLSSKFTDITVEQTQVWVSCYFLSSCLINLELCITNIGSDKEISYVLFRTAVCITKWIMYDLTYSICRQTPFWSWRCRRWRPRHLQPRPLGPGAPWQRVGAVRGSHLRWSPGSEGPSGTRLWPGSV